MKRVLNIPVSAALLRAWEAHFAPETQPFYLSDEQVARLDGLPLWRREELRADHLPLSVRDTLGLHDVAPEAAWALLLDEAGFGTLPGALKAELLETQLAFRRGGLECDPQTAEPYVWWPGVWRALSSQERWSQLKTFLEDDRLPCRRAELSSRHRQALHRRFPALIRLMGTFARSSGPNCFGSVMAACGVPGVSSVWMHAPPFLRWLNRVAVPGAPLDLLGTVLVWHDASGHLQHAALSLGNGWIFHKEAQAWFAPRQVMRLQDALERWQHEGWTISGYALS